MREYCERGNAGGAKESGEVVFRRRRNQTREGESAHESIIMGLVCRR